MAYKHFKFEIDNDGIALATLDSPDRSMNIIDAEVMHEWEAIIDEASQNDAIKGVVITSGKKAFGGGADLSMLQNWLENYHEQKLIDKEAATKKLFEDGRILSQLYRKQETCGKPFVAAINGLALGGFTEMILACHARVVAEGLDAKIGLPEVKIGIFPGAGGTQRLPRIIHTQEALQAMLKGSNIIPKKAKSLGLANALVPLDQIVSTAKQLINDGLSPVQPWDQKGFKIPGGKVYSPAGFQLFPAANAIYRRETYDNYPGARAIMKCVYEGLNLPIDLALQVEARYFADVLTTTPASMMLRTLFHSLQAVNKGMRRPKDAPKSDIKKVGIIGGGGFMGAGIGYVSAKAGLDIVLLDRDIQSAEKGRAHCEAIEDKAISKRRSTDAKKHALLEHIEVSADYASLADCDLVIEAVFEDSEVKKLATQQAEKHMKADAIFASNTSTIPITDLAKNSKDANNFIGIHFFSPVDRMMLTEIIVSEQTSDKALAVALDYVRAIKKTPIVVNDTRGFFINRCVLRYMSEAYNMLIEGVPAAMIENIAKMAGMPVGPLALNDETAIDLSHKILHQMIRDLGESAVDAKHIELVNTMVETHGRLGRKNLKGFYEYPQKPAKKHLWSGLKDLYKQQSPDAIDVQEMKDRYHAVIALEAARCVEENVITDVREADVGSILGFGFAPFTGGVLSYIDGMGTAQFVEKCEALHNKYGAQFKPNKLLIEMAKTNEKFYERFSV